MNIARILNQDIDGHSRIRLIGELALLDCSEAFRLIGTLMEDDRIATDALRARAVTTFCRAIGFSPASATREYHQLRQGGYVGGSEINSRNP